MKSNANPSATHSFEFLSKLGTKIPKFLLNPESMQYCIENGDLMNSLLFDFAFGMELSKHSISALDSFKESRKILIEKGSALTDIEDMSDFLPRNGYQQEVYFPYYKGNSDFELWLQLFSEISKNRCENNLQDHLTHIVSIGTYRRISNEEGVRSSQRIDSLNVMRNNQSIMINSGYYGLASLSYAYYMLRSGFFDILKHLDVYWLSFSLDCIKYDSRDAYLNIYIPNGKIQSFSIDDSVKRIT